MPGRGAGRCVGQGGQPALRLGSLGACCGGCCVLATRPRRMVLRQGQSVTYNLFIVTIPLRDRCNMERCGCVLVLLAGLGLVAIVAAVLVLRHRRRAARGPHDKGLDAGGQATAVAVPSGPARPRQPTRQPTDLGVTISVADVAANVARYVGCAQ